MSTKNLDNVEFNNFFSRILLKNNYRYQFTIPIDKSPGLMNLLKFVENRVMNIDLSGIPVDRPIFIISLPRTGSTMLQNIICAHEQVGYFSHTMNNYYPYFAPVDWLREKLDLNLKGERFIGDSIMVDTTSASDPIHIWNSWIRKDPFVAKHVLYRKEDLSQEQIDEIYTSIKKALWCQKGGKNRFLIKSPGMLAYLPLVNDLFPDAKYIHLVRDPRHCANSLIKLTKKSIAQIELISKEIKNYKHAGKTPVSYPHVPKLPEYMEQFGVDNIKTAANVVEDSINMVNDYRDNLANFHEVRYEDILQNPSQKLEELLNFCDLELPDKSNQAFWDQMNNVGTVKHKNNYTDYEIVESICSGSMAKYGYEKENAPADSKTEPAQQPAQQEETA